jgi:hypothetical protein
VRTQIVAAATSSFDLHSAERSSDVIYGCSAARAGVRVGAHVGAALGIMLGDDDGAAVTRLGALVG